ncbi:hypothetical protein BKA69DRAFT_1173290 [Paraphysoderma sedebokerense]|nr:hypothetical protein BKA69DRAFT_1173290 [Paraphysoderma sedebokerense]
MSSYILSAPSTRPYTVFVKEIDLNYPISLKAFNKQILPFLNQTLKKFTNLRRLSLAPLDANLVRNETSIIAFGERVVAVLQENLPVLKSLEYLSFPCTAVRSLGRCLLDKEFEHVWSKIETIHLRQLFDRIDLARAIVGLSPNIQEIDIGFKKSKFIPVITTANWFKLLRSRFLRRINFATISCQPYTAIKATKTPSVTSLSLLVYPNSRYFWQKWVFESLPHLTDLKITECESDHLFLYEFDISWLKPLLPRLRSLTYVGTGNYIHECIGMARNLESLSFKNISLSDVSFLRNLRLLKEVTFDKCGISKKCEMNLAKFLCDMTTLQQLTVIGWHGPEFYQFLIDNITHVRILSIDFNERKPDFIAFMKFLVKRFHTHPYKSWPQIMITIPAKTRAKREKWYSLVPKSAGIVHFRCSPHRLR